MNWHYYPAENGYAEVWQLNAEGDNRFTRAWHEGLLFLIRLSEKDGWDVMRKNEEGHLVRYGNIPSVTPEEELKALAVTLWRLSE